MTIALLGVAALCAPAFGADMARPGTVNYIEGAAYLDGTQLQNRNVGSTALDPGQVLTTGAGKAEVLLTPGIFLRVDSNSAVKMISPDLTQTQVEVDRGRAAVEVDQIFPQNEVQIMDGGVTTQLMKPGYYEFDGNTPEAMVFKGRAEVQLGDGKWETVKDHHELALVADGPGAKTASFDSKPTNDELYNWSSLRSQYLAEANNQIAGEYNSAPGFYPGWYWDPYMFDYTYLGWNPFFSPFGWGFYPWGGFHGGVGFYGRGYYGHGYYGGHPVTAGGGRAFSGGVSAGGGFHGGGGGFHGGGGGGRR